MKLERKVNMITLTKSEAKMLHVIYHFQMDNGYSPTYEWLMSFMGLKSKSGVARLVTSMVDKGYLAKHGKQKRGLIIQKLPVALEEREYKTA